MLERLFMIPANVRTAVDKWNETTHYNHTVTDLMNMMSGSGRLYLYHGAPEEYANQLVKNGTRPQYTTSGLGRLVAVRYGLDWNEYRRYAPRAASMEVVSKLSTAPALIAMRWASSFTHGEVLSDLNSTARVLVEAKRLAKINRTATSVEYNKLEDMALTMSKNQSLRYFRPSSTMS